MNESEKSVRSRYRESYADLAARQKTAKGAPGYSRWINRRLGRHLAAYAHAIGATPDQVTILSALCTFSGIAMIALVAPGVPVSFVASLLLVLGYALDSADGQLARLRGGGTAAGEWLDHVIDAFKTASFHSAILICLARFSGLDHTWLLIPVAYTVIACAWFFTVWITDALRRSARQAGATAASEPSAPAWRSLAALPTDYGVLCLAVALLPWTPVFLGCYAALLIGTTLWFAAALPVWRRELKALG